MKKRFIFPILISLIIVVLVLPVVFRLNQISKIVLDNENNIVQAQGPGELKPYKNKWLSSYETLCFDTADGDLDKKQYALDEAGKGYYIRTKSKDESQFEHADLSYDISKLERVNVIPGAKCYYDEFLTAKGAEAIWGKEKKKEIPSGGILRIPSNAKKYWDTAKIKDYPQPERIEMVEELPPSEPEPTSPEHQSIAFDATSNSGIQGIVSSYSWSHTCTGDNRLLVVGESHKGSTVVEIATSAKDSMLLSSSPGGNYNTGYPIRVTSRSDYINRTPIEFDISELPAGITIDSATLQLYYYHYYPRKGEGRTVWAYKLSRTDWVETQVSWNNYKTGLSWTNPGGDYVTENPSGGSTTIPGSYGWMSWDVKEIVQDAYSNSNPAEFLLKFEVENYDNDTYSQNSFYAKEGSYPPKLLIDGMSITYNSVPLTKVRSDEIEYLDWVRNSLFYLVAPDTGPNTVTITFSATIASGSGGAISYTGAAQTGQPDAHNGATAYFTENPTVSVTTVADNCWVMSVTGGYVSTISSNNTSRWDFDYHGGGSDTGGSKSPAGSQIMSWNSSGAEAWAISAASFAPAEETPSLTLTVDSPTKSLGNITPGTPVTATTTTTVTTGDSKGYSLKISDSVAGSNSALLHTDTTTRIADYSGTIASPTLWSEGATGLGICVYAADTSKEAKWGTGTTETDSNNKYAGIPQTATEIHNVGSAVTDDDTYIGYKLDAPSSQKTGTYSGDVTYTAVVNP